MNRSIAIISAFLLLGAARETSAQGFVSPIVAATLNSPTSADGHGKPGFGMAFGRMGAVVGAETEIAYFSEFLKNSANGTAKNTALTFSADALIGPTMSHVKPYVALGAGSLILNVTNVASVVVPTPDSIGNNYFTFNAGGGVMGFFTDHLGARADLRYTRAFGFNIDEKAGLALKRFDFWRASFGIALKF
ncbi:MAG: outer membrane beta-barrel protein [Vicinamibacterales bacterium]